MNSRVSAELDTPEPESKESTRPLVFTSTKWARTSDFSDTVGRQNE